MHFDDRMSAIESQVDQLKYQNMDMAAARWKSLLPYSKDDLVPDDFQKVAGMAARFKQIRAEAQKLEQEKMAIFHQSLNEAFETVNGDYHRNLMKDPSICVGKMSEVLAKVEAAYAEVRPSPHTGKAVEGICCTLS